MVRSEVAELIRKIEGLYSSFKPASLTLAVTEWANVLGKYDYEDAQEALYVYADDANKFPPSTGELAKIIKDLSVKKGKESRRDYYARKWAEAHEAYENGERYV